ncbi:hypothetical protein DID88_003300 [Monilinia fructigena]|uniref:Major facilitator superfamily (MFS) profile domain-containing protein n=1 Tax=Monilinia fructigena TaxID=38457 RepID=A0A395IV31_9HELO|nr:hypothetical protein DID88_003300 [Monilinia fructigena]
MKFLGLRIGEAKEEYEDVVISLENTRRHPIASQEHGRPREDRPKSSETGESLPSSGVSNQESTESLKSKIPWTMESLRDEIEVMGSESASNSESGSEFDIEKKFRLLELAISDIGVGRYQLLLFILCGTGWAADNLWLQGVALILPSLAVNFGVSDQFVRYATLSLNVGLSIGAAGWGVGSDIKGRRLGFNCTLIITGIFALGLASAPNFAAACAFLGALGVGVGGASPWMEPCFIESPKYLLGINEQAEAVRSVRALAHRNRTHTWLTEEILNNIGGTRERAEEVTSNTMVRVRQAVASLGPETKRKVLPLFGTRQLGINTALLWFIWAAIGMGYPLFNAFLPQYLSSGHEAGDASTTYRDYSIISAVAVPGSFLACYLVSKAGRRIPMAVATMITGVFFFLFTIRDENIFQLIFGCVASFFQNIMFGILYAYSPETFPGPSRGTGCGIAHSLSRLGGICAPLIAANVGASNPSLPIYVSGGLILAAFLAMCFLRIETQNRQSL